MSKKVPLSGEQLNLSEINDHYDNVTEALKRYFNPANGYYDQKFAGCSATELESELQACLEEIDRTSTLSVLSAIEAIFRIDYLERCYTKKKDPISRVFRQLYKEEGPRVSFEKHILSVWEREATGASIIIARLKNVFKYRHWLAHGRYWVLKIGQKNRYDYQDVFLLAETLINSFPFVS
ncbi:MAG: hypothetical protein WC647_01385 [Desulfomonilaceae bacterium]|jgi:hypothetical protein